MKASWKIVPVKSRGPIGYRWRWTKATEGKIIERSAECFDYYYDCLVDAQKHGFRDCQITTTPIMLA